MERLDKIVSISTGLSRTNSRAAIKSGRVKVNGEIRTVPESKADEYGDIILLDGKRIFFQKFIYIMMNKPKGVVSVTEDKTHKTAIDLLPESYGRRNLFPAGRLDRDTTGFLLITDDGDFAHRILSPKNHIEKEYVAEVDKEITPEVLEGFKSGIKIGEETTKPSGLEIISDDKKKAKVVLTQGMYHQIKRMFGFYGIKVLELRRIRMGKLYIDEALGDGEFKELNMDDIGKIAQ